MCKYDFFLIQLLRLSLFAFLRKWGLVMTETDLIYLLKDQSSRFIQCYKSFDDYENQKKEFADHARKSEKDYKKKADIHISKNSDEFDLKKNDSKKKIFLDAFEAVFLGKTSSNYEKKFKEKLIEVLNDKSIFHKPPYEIMEQVPWLILPANNEKKSRLIYWDFVIRKDKNDNGSIFIELDDGNHCKTEDDNLLEDTDYLKNESIKRFGYYLIRVKAANYMYGVKSLGNGDYSANFIKPYGESLLIEHLKKCLDLALHHRYGANRGEYICCPDGYKIEGMNADDKFYKSNHKTTYRTDIFSLGNDFQFNLNYIKNK